MITMDDIRLPDEEKVEVLNLKSGVWLIAEAGGCSASQRVIRQIKDILLCEKRAQRDDPLTEDEFNRDFPVEYKFDHNEHECKVMIVLPSGDFWVVSGKYGVEGKYKRVTRYGMGIAEAYLLGAMESGKDPEEAVMLACKRFVSCGGELKTYKAGYGKWYLR